MNYITLVCGFPRSGTSLMMRLIQAAGVPLYYDHEHSFETDKIQGLPERWQWMEECVGKAVKVLDPHEWTPPPFFNYRVIWMDRNAGEQAKSQAKMLRLVGGCRPKPDQVNRVARQLISERDAALKVVHRLAHNPVCDVMMVNFETLIEQPLVTCGAICGWLQISSSRADCMAGLIDKRNPDCLPHLRELAYLHTTPSETPR